jgi:predicted DNA-binding ribbon-helix-helix protein
MSPTRFFISIIGGHAMKSLNVKHSITIAGRRTSICLEGTFWNALRQIAAERDQTLSRLVGAIDANRQQSNLSSAIRLFVLGYYRDRLDSHDRISSREGRTLEVWVA